MTILLRRSAFAAACLVSLAGQAAAAAKCSLTGTWTDLYGATAVISGKKGTLTFSAVCKTPYAIKVSGETKTGFNVNGTNQTKSCGTFAVALTFQGSCTVASGSVEIDGFKVDDTFTNQGAHVSAPAGASALETGLK
jgi:hypothetical protein